MAALLIGVGAPRLRWAGLSVPAIPFQRAEHRPYEAFARDHVDSAHSRYNALIRRLVSFERAWECGGLADAKRIRAFMDAVGRAAKREIQMRHFEEVEPLLYRFPAVDPATFRRAVEGVCRPGGPPEAR